MRITCVVDNQATGGLKAEHGSSYLIEAGSQFVLFDTGATSNVLAHNLAALDIAPHSLDALVLSHGHPDHTGGLAGLMPYVHRIPLTAHPAVVAPRFRLGDHGELEPRGISFSEERLNEWFRLNFTTEAVEVIPDVWTTGEITERHAPEGRSRHHVITTNGGLKPDPYRDDLSLVLHGAEGLVLLCGCCHAGLINTLRQVQRLFGRAPCAVVGGMHLIDSQDAEIEGIVDLLRGFGPPELRCNHCTGTRGLAALSHAFGSRVRPFPAGSMLAIGERGS